MEILVFEVSEDQFNNLPDDSVLEVTFCNTQNSQHLSHHQQYMAANLPNYTFLLGFFQEIKTRKLWRATLYT